MFMVDLAVPRDIEPEVGELDDVFLYTVDDLGADRQREPATRARSAVAQAEAIIETQVGQFMHWLQARESVPLIRALREQAERRAPRELERALRMLARGDDAGAGARGAVAGPDQQAAARADAGAATRPPGDERARARRASLARALSRSR